MPREMRSARSSSAGSGDPGPSVSSARTGIFRKEGDKNFRRLVVQADGLAPDGMQEIRDGVKAGDEVVANALEFATEVAERK